MHNDQSLCLSLGVNVCALVFVTSGINNGMWIARFGTELAMARRAVKLKGVRGGKGLEEEKKLKGLNTLVK